MYSAGGAPIRRDTAGTGSQTIGHELDLAMKISLDVHTDVFIGYSHVWPGGFIERTGDNDSPDLFYAQIEYKF